MIVFRSWSYSVGKVDHDILLVCALFVLAFSRWGDELSLETAHDRPPESAAWPQGLLALVIAFGMLNSGIQKVGGGWLSTDGSATVGWMVFMVEAWQRQSPAYPYLGKLMGLPPFLVESLDWTAVAFEFAFVPALLHRRAFQFMCLFGVSFHFATWLMLDIYFPSHPPVYAAFIPWVKVFKRLPQGTGQYVLAALRMLPVRAAIAVLVFVDPPTISTYRIVVTFLAIFGMGLMTITALERTVNRRLTR
jgi:hypothetical protein